MTDEEIDHLNRAAESIGLMELIRIAIAEICFDEDVEVFREKMRKLESAAVNSINSRTSFSKLSPEADQYVKDASSGFVTRIVSSIRHPEDR
ncbi:hypothetical protein GN325_20605 [Agrobacterium vitis]|uniref:hypothetical protein n=1 Tax=Agrobacterium vitis TaxID=373 RepID=UPI0012E7F8A0|nr:hypothetical protein [Agrobacterium vitis]MVB04168.1 hypothetical protein [Agrobacterium vitis]